MSRPGHGALAGWLVISCLVAICPEVLGQQSDHSAKYLSGRTELDQETSGRLILADTAVFFTKRNGQPIFTLPYATVTESYGTPDLYGDREQRKGHYLVVVVTRGGLDQPVVFELDPFVPDTLARRILAKLDARRVAMYSGATTRKPPTTGAENPAISTSPPARTLVDEKNPRPVDGDVVPEIQAGTPGYKDGGTATLLSLLITGGGQFYAGETGKGAFFLVGAIAAVGIGAGLSSSECGFSCDDNLQPLYIGAGVAVFLSLASVFDAAPAARRHNRKLAARRASLGSISPMLLPTSSGTKVGLNLAVGW